MKFVSFKSVEGIAHDDRLKDEKAISTRVITGLGIFLFLVYTIIDTFGLPKESLEILYPVRGTVVIILGIIFALTYQPIFQKHYNKILNFGYYYTGFAICVAIDISQKGEYSYDMYFAVFMVLIISAFSWSYLPLRHSLAMATFFIITYALIKIYHHQDFGGMRTLALIANLFFLLSVCVIATSAQYIRDSLIFRNLQLQDKMKLFAEQKVEEAERNERLANIDHLTGIANRRRITDSLRREIVDSEQNDLHFTLVFIDLNGFKKINDYYGHDAGDEVLKATAKRLIQLTREGDYVARLGGDEFLFSVRNQEHSSRYMLNLDRKLREIISAPINFNKETLSVGASVGYASYPEDGDMVEDVIKTADKHMYIDKQNIKRVSKKISA